MVVIEKSLNLSKNKLKQPEAVTLSCLSLDGYKKKTYVGYSTNVLSRLQKHNNSKGAKSTRGYKWEVIFKKRFKSKEEAMSFEYLLKKDRKKRLSILKELL